ncbi:MAG: polysaccharide pyruvyl transferase family protein [Alphaproteobacteria bacterium]
MPDKLLNDGKWLFNYLASLNADEHAETQPLSSADTLADAWLDSLTDQGAIEWHSVNVTHARQLCEKDLQLARTESKAVASSQQAQRHSRSGQPSFILLNDTRQIDGYTHLGCNAVTHFIIEQAAQLGLAWHGSASNLAECNALVADKGFENVSLVIFNGEGSMHHDSPRCLELMEFCRAMKKRGIACALVNSVWHENTEVLGQYLELFDIVSVRETNSLAEIRQFRPDARLTPDFSFAALKNNAQHFDRGSFRSPLRQGIRVIDSVDSYTTERLREFAEINALPFFLMGGVQAPLTTQERAVFTVDGTPYPRVFRDLLELEGAELCVTGRFHGLIAALLKGIPTFALPSNTPKVEGVLVDIGISDIALLEQRWLQLSNAECIVDLQDRAFRWDARVADRVSTFAIAAERKIMQLFNDMVHDSHRLAKTKPKTIRWVSRVKRALSHTPDVMRR